EALGKTHDAAKKDGKTITVLISRNLIESVRQANVANQLDLLQDRFAANVIDLNKRRDVEETLEAGNKLLASLSAMHTEFRQAPRLTQQMQMDKWDDLLPNLVRIYRFQGGPEFAGGDKVKLQALARGKVVELRRQAEELVRPAKKGDAPAGPKDLDKQFEQ